VRPYLKKERKMSVRFTVVDVDFGVSHKPEETFQISYLPEVRDWSILPVLGGIYHRIAVAIQICLI
jgi:hypothetical protein